MKRNYPSIKKIQDIDILSNNNEEKLSDIIINNNSSGSYGIEDRTPSPQKENSPLLHGALAALNIDVSQIAIQIGFSPSSGNAYDLQSIASNEQLVFKSELEGRTNNMNTNELKDEISNKLNPSMYRQMFTLGSSLNPNQSNGNFYEEESPQNKYGKLISEIPEEDEESGSFDCLQSDEEDAISGADEESK